MKWILAGYYSRMFTKLHSFLSMPYSTMTSGTHKRYSWKTLENACMCLRGRQTPIPHLDCVRNRWWMREAHRNDAAAWWKEYSVQWITSKGLRSGRTSEAALVWTLHMNMNVAGINTEWAQNRKMWAQKSQGEAIGNKRLKNKSGKRRIWIRERKRGATRSRRERRRGKNEEWE